MLQLHYKNSLEMQYRLPSKRVIIGNKIAGSQEINYYLMRKILSIKC